jgi:hypothetical protein
MAPALLDCRLRACRKSDHPFAVHGRIGTQASINPTNESINYM